MKDMLGKERFSPGMQMGLLLMFCGLGLILNLLISLVIFKVNGVAASDVNALLTNPKYLSASRLLQSVTAICVMALPPFLLSMMMTRNTDYIGFNRMLSGKQVFFLVLMLIPAGIVADSLSQLTHLIPLPAETAKYFKSLDDSYNKTVMLLAHMPTLRDYLISLVVIALIPAIAEEMLFRGGLQNVLSKMFSHPLPPIIITSVVFSLIHFSFYGFLSRVFLGVILGMIYHNSRNLWLSILLHFLNNAFIVTQLYSMQRAGVDASKALEEGVPVWYGLFALPLLWMMMAIFLRESKQVHAYYILDEEINKTRKQEQDNDGI